MHKTLRKMILIVAALCAAGFLGCQDNSLVGLEDEEETSAGLSEERGDSSTPLIEYRRFSEIDDFDETLFVTEEGDARLVQGKKTFALKLDPGVLSRLRNGIERAEIDSLESEYLSDDPATGLSFEIKRGDKTIRTRSGSVPVELQPTLTELNQIVRSAKESGG